MQKLYLLAQQLGHSPRTLRAAVIDADNGIAHEFVMSSNHRDTLYVLDVPALKRWIAANISTQAHAPISPTYKTKGARVYLRKNGEPVYGVIEDTRGEGDTREVYVCGEWRKHNNVRLAKGGKE